MPHKRRYLGLAILALALAVAVTAATALGSSKSKSNASAANSILGATPNPLGNNSSQSTNCGYGVSGASNPYAVFGVKENTTLPAFRPAQANGAATTPTNPATLTAGSTMQAYYVDEHNMTFGTKNVDGTIYASQEMAIASDPGSTNTFAAATTGNGNTPRTGATIAQGGDASPSGSNGGVDDRPLSPELYVTDLTANPGLPTATYTPPGDWQALAAAYLSSGRNAANSPDGATPDDLFGQWKNATVTNEAPSTVENKVAGGDSPTTLTQAKWNGTATSGNVPNLGQDQFPSNSSGYLAEIRWNAQPVAGSPGSFTLGGANGSRSYTLTPGRTYRLQFELNDGDHGLDSGEACTYVKVPPAKPVPTTTAGVGTGGTTDAAGVKHIKLQPDTSFTPNKLDAAVNDTLTLTGGTANAGTAGTDCTATPTPAGCLIFRLYKQATGTVTEASCRGGSTPGTPVTDVNGNAVVVYMAADNGANNTGAGDPNGVYTTPDKKLTHPGTYHWTVQYTGNTENDTFAGRSPAIALSSGETFCNINSEKLIVDPAKVNVETSPEVKVQEDTNIKITVGGSSSANASGAIKAGDAVTIQLRKGTCDPADPTNGGTQQGNTISITLANRPSGSPPPAKPPAGQGWINDDGTVTIGTLNYPADFGSGAPALVNADYWWSVVYQAQSSNDQVEQSPSNDGCSETFTISGLK